MIRTREYSSGSEQQEKDRERWTKPEERRGILKERVEEVYKNGVIKEGILRKFFSA